MLDYPPSTFTHLEDSATGRRRDANTLATIDPDSGRALLARYDLDRASGSLDLETLRGRRSDLWRYAEVLPVLDRAFAVTLGEGWTPVLPALRTGRRLGLEHLVVKDEGRNPTGTFKARGMALAVSKAWELGATALAVPTAGNAGAALAAYAARAGLPAHVAMPADAPASIQAEVRSYGATLVKVDGLIHDAGKLIAEGCREHGWFGVATTKEPYRVEGKKTMGYELWEQYGGELPDVVLYPTGGGTGLIGMWKAWDELEAMGKIDSRRPRLIAVQSADCAPVVRAVTAGAETVDPWENAASVAPGIRVPRPFAGELVLQALRDTDGTAIAVPDDAIVPAMHRLAAADGFDACPEGAATLVALEQMVEDRMVDRDERIVLFNCGTGLKHPELRPAG
ncbi:MAG: threonine synthase [Acidobacteriota bacterium]